MSADRFETELRDLLRTEAAAAPVEMSIAELRARAGRRTRRPWSGWPRPAWFAIAGGGLAAVALVVAFGITRGPRLIEPGSSPSVPASPVMSDSPSANPLAPSPTAVAFDSGPSGSLLIARTDGDVVTIIAVLPDGTERIAGRIDGLAGVAALDPTAHLEDDAVQAIGPAGDVLITITAGDGDTFRRTNVVARVGGTLATDRVVPGGQGTFGPDGALVLIAAGPSGRPIVERGFPVDLSFTRTTAPDGVLPSGSRPILLADGSGVVASRDRDDGTDEAVVLQWDGTTRALGPAEALWTPTRTERIRGAAGEQISHGCDTSGSGSTGGCVVLVIPAGKTVDDGTNVAFDGEAFGDAAWMPDGRGVVMRATDGVAYWDSTTTRKVNTLPASFRTSGASIVGILGSGPAGAAVLGGFDGTTIVPLDGRPVRTLPGTFLGIVP